MLLGLSGGYCAGKNRAAAALAERGWACVDVDKLGHEAMDLARDAIAARFGDRVLDAAGRIDRRAVAAIVFSEPEALRDQEAIVHPVAKRLLDERVARLEAEARERGQEARICVNAALLHRTGLVPRLAAILEIRAPLATRVLRGARRDGAGLLAALRRILRQRGFRRALRSQAAAAGIPVAVVRNPGGEARLARRLEAALGGLGLGEGPRA